MYFVSRMKSQTHVYNQYKPQLGLIFITASFAALPSYAPRLYGQWDMLAQCQYNATEWNTWIGIGPTPYVLSGRGFPGFIKQKHVLVQAGT